MKKTKLLLIILLTTVSANVLAAQSETMDNNGTEIIVNENANQETAAATVETNINSEESNSIIKIKKNKKIDYFKSLQVLFLCKNSVINTGANVQNGEYDITEINFKTAVEPGLIFLANFKKNFLFFLNFHLYWVKQCIYTNIVIQNINIINQSVTYVLE